MVIVCLCKYEPERSNPCEQTGGGNRRLIGRVAPPSFAVNGAGGSGAQFSSDNEAQMQLFGRGGSVCQGRMWGRRSKNPSEHERHFVEQRE